MTDTIHHSRCPLCGNSKIVPFITATDHLVSHDQFEIDRCEACGFQFTQDAPSSATIAPYYESENYQPHSNRSGLMPLIYRSVRSMMLRRKRSLINRYHPQAGTILDVGAGCGHFLAFMRDSGWSAVGCEQSSNAREYARQQFHLQLDEEVMKCEYPAREFDVITAWHSIEHIHDLHGLWERFKQMIKTDGLLVVAVPNCESMDASFYGSRWAALDVPRHLWHFNANTITLLAEQHGFKLIKTHSMPLDAGYISLLSDSNKAKAVVNGVRFVLAETIQQRKAGSLIYFFRVSP